MKVWKTAKFLKKDKNIELITRSYINYIYKYGPINDIIRKYNINPSDVYKLNQYTANRIAGLILLYLAKDKNGRMRTVTEYVKEKRRLAFAGFFPYDHPQYSCIVVVDKPDLHSAGRVSGAVFRAIAEEMYDRNMLGGCAGYQSDKEEKQPPIAMGDTTLSGNVYAYLRQYPLPDTTAMAKENDTTAVAEVCDASLVPSVIGLSAKDALYKLERQGFFVSISGKGRVVSQSLKPGEKYTPGENIALLLN